MAAPGERKTGLRRDRWVCWVNPGLFRVHDGGSDSAPDILRILGGSGGHDNLQDVAGFGGEGHVHGILSGHPVVDAGQTVDHSDLDISDIFALLQQGGIILEGDAIRIHIEEGERGVIISSEVADEALFHIFRGQFHGVEALGNPELHGEIVEGVEITLNPGFVDSSFKSFPVDLRNRFSNGDGEQQAQGQQHSRQFLHFLLLLFRDLAPTCLLGMLSVEAARTNVLYTFRRNFSTTFFTVFQAVAEHVLSGHAGPHGARSLEGAGFLRAFVDEQVMVGLRHAGGADKNGIGIDVFDGAGSHGFICQQFCADFDLLQILAAG